MSLLSTTHLLLDIRRPLSTVCYWAGY